MAGMFSSDDQMSGKRVMRIFDRTQRVPAFTLVELIVVILIIGVLASFLFPVFQGILNQAKKTHAKNDVTQIVTAVNAYYTEYGKYPNDATSSASVDIFYGTGTAPSGVTVTATNDKVIDVLSNNTTSTSTAGSGGNLVATLNPRGIVFITVPFVKSTTRPMSGVIPAGSAGAGVWYDPWGSPYNVLIDGGYDNQLTNPYTANTGAGPGTLRIGICAWSFGKNGARGGGPAANSSFASESGTANSYNNSSDVISWQ